MNITPLEAWIHRKIDGGHSKLVRSSIETYQLDRINENIGFVKRNSPFYGDLLKNYPERISSLLDIKDIPFTTSDDIRNHGTEMVCVPQGDISRIVTMSTSGTTGPGKRIFFTRSDQDLTVDFFGVGMSTFVNPGNRVLILLPDSTPGSVGDLLYNGLLRIGAIPMKHGPVVDLSETLSVISQQKINCLVGVPTQVLALSNFYKLNSDSYPVEIRSILLSTDHVPYSVVARLENTWNCRVFNHYGMTEMGLGGGVFCEANYGYHLREADMFFEIIDPITGSPVPYGSSGEFVFTTLTREGMPLIRYRTGDRARFLVSPCPCGTILKSLEKIDGRLDQTVFLSGIPIHMSDFDECLFRFKELINFEFTCSRKDGLDLFSFHIYSLTPLKHTRLIIDSLREFFSARHVNLDSVGILITQESGYSHELASMRKRIIHFKN